MRLLIQTASWAFSHSFKSVWAPAGGVKAGCVLGLGGGSHILFVAVPGVPRHGTSTPVPGRVLEIGLPPAIRVAAARSQVALRSAWTMLLMVLLPA